MIAFGLRRLPNLPLPTAGWPLLILIAVFLLAGTLGHDPWKIEDAAHFGVVWRTLAAGDWLSFRFAAGAVVEPPLYYGIGTALGTILSPVLAWPDAVRLASPLFAAIACALLYVAAREWHGRDAAGAAPLILVGALGFLVQSHETQPMIAALAGISAAYAGLALGARRSWSGGALIGAGCAGVLLAHGATLLPALLLTIAAGVAVSPARANSARAALSGIGIAIVLSAPWMASLYNTSPSAFKTWWATEFAQFASVGNPGGNALRYADILVWFAWPALPLALWTLWANRRRLAEPGHALPLAACALMLANAALAFEARVVSALAVLPAFALVAVPGATSLRRGAANAFDWFGRMTFSLAAGLIWLGWTAMNFGVPTKIARNFAKLSPGFEAAFDPVSAAVAATASVLWLWLIIARAPASPPPTLRPLAHWASGITLLWVLVNSLWLPWIDHGKTYRSVAAGISDNIGAGCISTRDLGEAQYASLDYFLAHRLRAEVADAPACRWLVIQGQQNEQSPGPRWRKLWDGARPGDKSERFRLYRRL